MYHIETKQMWFLLPKKLNILGISLLFLMYSFNFHMQSDFEVLSCSQFPHILFSHLILKSSTTNSSTTGDLSQILTFG